MRRVRHLSQTFVVVALCTLPAAGASPLAFRTQEISHELSIGYATRLLDMNEDGKPDILVVDTERVVWFENPTWQLHTIIEHQTKRDNVSIASADIDGDGKIDLALAADWRPSDTRTSGTLQWLSRGATPHDKWQVHPIATEPTIHRIRFADLDGDGKEELLVVPLFGRNSTAPDFAEAAVRILSYRIPADPVAGPWVPQVLNEDLHVAHNFWPTDLNGDGKLDILVASFEGVSLLMRDGGERWKRTLVGSGEQATSPSRGASEIKHGRLASGADYLATIEPWHGSEVVVYGRPTAASPAASSLWPRQVLDTELRWGHAVWCADLDGDHDEELIV
ncbi:MAG TPA: VCBS repeat-containing protein, partial [Pirellulales bacterium]|nr:VCBS repeat-containing protein [Pirellulales bacterium]